MNGLGLNMQGSIIAVHKVRDGSLFTTLKYLQQTIERKWLLTNTSEEYQVSQKSVRLCNDLPSCKQTLFWDTL